MTDDPSFAARHAPRPTALNLIPQAAGPGPVESGACAEGLDADLMALLGEAMLCCERAAAEAQVAAVMRYGIPRQVLIDSYIPATARRFGEAWCMDQRSFAEVTIAVARLQGWLRDLDLRADGLGAFRLDAPEILLVVPEGSQHTLGAMVAMSQFRRLGAAVRLSLGQDADTVGNLVRRHGFDLVAISAAGCERLEFLRTLVNRIRMGVAPAPRVIIGGPIVAQIPDIGERLGADAATSDPKEALALCVRTTSTGDVPQCLPTAVPQRGPPRATAVPAS